MRVPRGSSDMTEAEVLYFKSKVLKSSQTERGKMSNKGPGKKKCVLFKSVKLGCGEGVFQGYIM